MPGRERAEQYLAEPRRVRQPTGSVLEIRVLRIFRATITQRDRQKAHRPIDPLLMLRGLPWHVGVPPKPRGAPRNGRITSSRAAARCIMERKTTPFSMTLNFSTLWSAQAHEGGADSSSGRARPMHRRIKRSHVPRSRTCSRCGGNVRAENQQLFRPSLPPTSAVAQREQQLGNGATTPRRAGLIPSLEPVAVGDLARPVVLCSIETCKHTRERPTKS